MSFIALLAARPHRELARNPHASETSPLPPGRSLPFQRNFLLLGALRCGTPQYPWPGSMLAATAEHMKNNPSIYKGHSSVLSRKPNGGKIGLGATAIWRMSV